MCDAGAGGVEEAGYCSEDYDSVVEVSLDVVEPEVDYVCVDYVEVSWDSGDAECIGAAEDASVAESCEG